jgi:histone H3/H4
MSDMPETEAGSLVVASRVKQIVSSKGLQTSSDAIDALNRRIVSIIEEAVQRAKDNKRATVKPQDI